MSTTSKKIKTTEASRSRHIYMLAIEKAPNLDQLDPPATDDEIKTFKEMSKRMRETEANWPKDRPPLVWDIPFDLDY